jgi:hypothetical protein
MRVSIPADKARKIAERATQFCRQDLQGRGWTSARSLEAYSKEGLVGIRTSTRYLMYQEKGIGPFLMKWVEGRTLPLGCKMGDGPHFRKGSHVGEPGYVTLPHGGKVWREQRWRHPGIKPGLFMENAIRRAVEEAQSDLRSDVMAALRGEYHGL